MCHSFLSMFSWVSRECLQFPPKQMKNNERKSMPPHLVLKILHGHILKKTLSSITENMPQLDDQIGSPNHKDLKQRQVACECRCSATEQFGFLRQTKQGSKAESRLRANKLAVPKLIRTLQKHRESPNDGPPHFDCFCAMDDPPSNSL